MSTLMTQPAPTRRPNRRPFVILLFAFLILVIVIVVRLVLDVATPTAKPVQTPARLNTVVRPSQGAVAPNPAAQDAIAQLQEKLRNNPEDTEGYAELGLAMLQKVRETADPSLYPQAQTAFDEALKRDPQQLNAIVGQGVLALARHDFKGGLVWAQKAQALNPYRAQILGIAVDAQVELGQYDDAINTLQKMIDMRPDLASYSRVSYLRELNGDIPGAMAAMQTAINTAQAGTEPWLWTQVQLGNLYFNSGDLAKADFIYREALQMRPDYAYAQAGLARVQAAQGHLKEATATYNAVIQRLPLADMVITLGEWYEVSGNQLAAKQQYDLVNVIQQLNASAGMNVDLELALFNANHGDKALAEKQARAVYGVRPTILAADTLARALYQNGKYAEAQTYSEKALRLGTRDATFHFHAGMIAAALGDKVKAREHLNLALTINPNFSLLYAPQAQAKLKELGR
ncbi:hypothetical protein BH10CHL1_BH10CHL1_42260 [soil metagenome]